MDSTLRHRILSASDYPESWQLTDADITQILADCDAELRTTNGDAGTITLTVRQALLLLRAQAKQA